MWHEKYLDMPYVPVDGDCMALAELVAKEYLGIEVNAPPHEVGLRAQARQIAHYKDSLAERTDTPKDGYPVLFSCRKRFYHIGVYVFLNYEPWILHNDERVGKVVVTPLRNMAIQGYELEGFYKWI